jgi:hypothetical protein
MAALLGAVPILSQSGRQGAQGSVCLRGAYEDLADLPDVAADGPDESRPLR